jgi:hypothetical protein
MLEEITRFIGRSSGLKVGDSQSSLEIIQLIDGRHLKLNLADLEAVLPRQDQDGRPFLQLNLRENKKILLTDQLVGFKPRQTPGLDLKKLPRVVTTPDLISVLEAIEETMSSTETINPEAEMLKKAYFAIAIGAELIGFKMDSEKAWVIRLIASSTQKTA